MRSIWKKTLFLTAVSTVAIGFGTYLVFGLAAQSAVQDTVDISGNYGSEYGIHDIVTSTDDFIPGLPASTVNFQVDVSRSSGDPLVALTQVGKTLSRKARAEDPTLQNIKATSDDTTDQKLNFQFYPNSPSDYMDGTYDTAVNNTRRVLEENYLDNITVISKPTSSGTRTFNVEASVVASGLDADSTMQSAWNRLVESLNQIPSEGTRNTIKLSSFDERKMVIEGFYYSPESLSALGTLDERIFTTLSSYIVDTKLESLNIKEARFVIPNMVQSNDAEFQLTIAGDQPEDAAVVAEWAKNFTNNAYNKEKILLPWVSTTIARYENSVEAVYINYPTTMEW